MSFEDNKDIGPFNIPQNFEALKNILKIKEFSTFGDHEYIGYLQDGSAFFFNEYEERLIIGGSKEYEVNAEITLRYIGDTKEEDRKKYPAPDTIVHCIWANCNQNFGYLHSAFYERKDAEIVMKDLNDALRGLNGMKYILIMNYIKDVKDVYDNAESFLKKDGRMHVITHKF